MKRNLFIAGIGIIILFLSSLFVVHSRIGHSVKENISFVQKKYPGTAEDALISFLLDENNPTKNRTHIAIWTLGQIQSEMALPVLNEYYKNDPEGKTCYGKHDTELCQYEIYKAINAIEKGKLFSHARLK